MLVQSFMSRESAASSFAISNFPLVTSKIRYFEKSFEKSTTFHGKFARALLLHNTVNAKSHKSLEIQAWSITKPRTYSE